MPAIACTFSRLSHQLVEQTQVVRSAAGTTAPTDSAPIKLVTGTLRGTLGQGRRDAIQAPCTKAPPINLTLAVTGPFILALPTTRLLFPSFRVFLFGYPCYAQDAVHQDPPHWRSLRSTHSPHTVPHGPGSCALWVHSAQRRQTPNGRTSRSARVTHERHRNMPGSTRAGRRRY